MQQEGGGGGGGGGGKGQQSHQYREMSVAQVNEASEQLVVETASPISSRPPAVGGGGSLDEFTRLTNVGGGDELGLGGSGGGGGGGGGGPNGNRWPRQETLALLKIRSDMDATFRDATVKGPLWEDVSRKLAELGYKRNPKKCREKFENVHKYYKRTKENRAERQHGKSYKFFSELEAFYSTSVTTPVTPVTAVTAATLDVSPVLVGFPMPISTPVPVSFPPPQPAVAPVQVPVPIPVPVQPITTTEAPFGISFSSNSSTFSQGFDDHDSDDDEEDIHEAGRVQLEPSSMAGTSRKRKRTTSSKGGSKKIMEFMEGLMKQVMQKQESMQQRFLEAMEKREQDRNIREEAWKRQESARLTREHELLSQERAVAASRDAAIISLLQKITGQTIQLPKTVITPPAAPPPPPPSQPTVSVVQPPAPITTAPPLQPPPQQQQQQQHQQQQHQHQHQHQQQPIISSEIVLATPERQVRPSDISSSGSLMTESASSRWPKTEVLALINLRSGLESRYQEAGPKGPLWEEISAGMLRMGYRRNPKRCKEKWENINKYFKKVKESNKQRPEDAKTCPYFHQLDALYRKKILGGGTTSGIFSDHNRPQEETSQPNPPRITAAPQQSEHETGGTLTVVANKEGNDRDAKKSEYTVRELMEEQQQQQHNHGQSMLVVDGYDKMAELDSDNMDDDDDELEDDDDEEEEEMEVQRKMGYKIEFQRQNSSTPNGGGHNGAPSTFTMVQ